MCGDLVAAAVSVLSHDMHAWTPRWLCNKSSVRLLRHVCLGMYPGVCSHVHVRMHQCMYTRIFRNTLTPKGNVGEQLNPLSVPHVKRVNAAEAQCWKNCQGTRIDWSDNIRAYMPFPWNTSGSCTNTEI
jgi:hypothetical protein